MLAALAAGLKRWGGGNVFWPEVVSIAPLGEVAAMLQAAEVPVWSLEAAGNKDGRVVGRFVRHLQQAPRENVRIIFSILIHANMLAATARSVLEKEGAPGKRLWVQSIHTVQEKPRWHWWVQGMIGQAADAIVVPSHAVLRKLKRHGAVPRGSMVIPNGIDVQKFASATAIPPEDQPWPRDAFIIGYLGRFDPVKRIDLLIEAVAQLVARGDRFSRLHAALVGYGPQEEELRELAILRHVADRIHFPVSDGPGLGGTREPERWMKTFDLFCSPSPAEGFGLTLLEARAAGLPVIACGTEAVQEALGADDSGVIWMPEECGAHALAQMLEGAITATRRCAAPADVLAGWSVEKMVERYAGWLEEVAAAGL
jgi:glycosyltransferase involved in cell wall biosynthesis